MPQCKNAALSCWTINIGPQPHLSLLPRKETGNRKWWEKKGLCVCGKRENLQLCQVGVVDQDLWVFTLIQVWATIHQPSDIQHLLTHEIWLMQQVLPQVITSLLGWVVTKRPNGFRLWRINSNVLCKTTCHLPPAKHLMCPSDGHLC